MINQKARLMLGALTGLVSLIAMVRLVAGAFSGHLSVLVWTVILLAMVPWIGYVAVRARHGSLTSRSAVAVVALAVLGLLSVWLFTLGAVIALACSFAAFVVIWVHDWPPRRARSEDHFVRIEELATEDRD